MKKQSFILLIIILFLESCISKKRDQVDSIDFDSKCCQEVEAIQPLVCRDSLIKMYDYQLRYGTIQNNAYDTLSLYLFRTPCDHIYFLSTDHIDLYSRANPTDKSTQITCAFGYDTIININKGSAFSFVFRSQCDVDSIFQKIYYFNIKSDSMGFKRDITLSYYPNKI